MVRRRRSLLTSLRHRDDRAWPCRRHEHFCGQLLRLPQLHGRKLHRSQRHRCHSLSPKRFEASHSRDASATATGAITHTSKIGDSPLFATVGALAAVWLVATVGLSITIKREYLHTFVSLQTGYADTQSNFLDHQGNDARRVIIFLMNERHWQAIRDRVRQWVLSVYATWQALMPAFFTADLQARIPDDFMPAQAVQELNAQSPDGRRPTLQNMGLVRRMSHAPPTDGASELERRVPLPSELPSPPSVTDRGGAFTASSASIFPGSDPTEQIASAASRPHAAPDWCSDG